MQPPAPVAAPVAVRIFTIEGTRELETEGGVPRTTDLLNRTDDQLRIRESGGGDWEFVDVDELLVVVPPEQGSDPKMRLHRPRQQVRVKLGPYVVDGAAHVPAGSQATSFLVPQRHHFVPLTEATIQHDEQLRRLPRRGGHRESADGRVAAARWSQRRTVGDGSDMESDPPT